MTTLIELVTFNPKHHPDTERNQVISFVPMPAVDEHSGVITEPKERPLAETWKGFTHFANGDVIFAKITPCMENGKSAIARDLKNGIACGSTEFHVLRPNEGILADYLWRYLRQKSFRDEAAKQMTGAVGQRRVPKPYLEQFPFHLPPHAEQKRIVEKLDRLSARIRTAKDHLAKVQSLATRAKQTTLAAAFRGELTEDKTFPRPKTTTASFTDPFTHTQEAPANWNRFLFSDVCKIVGGSQPAKSNFVYTPRDGYIRLIQIRDYKSDKKATYIPGELARRFCSKSDIMIGRYGPPIFQILRGIEGAYNVALMKAVPTEAVNPEFLFWYLHHPMLFRYVEIDSKRTAGQDGVNKAHLERWPILLPPLDEQTEIVRRIETSFAHIDRMVAEATNAADLLVRLEQELLAKAFRGELVAQDPNDEPASVLLERIREARAAEKKTSPKSKRRREPPKKEANDAFKRSVLAAYIADTLCDHSIFGRVKFQKLLHLSEGYANANEVSGNYQRDAAGPFDTRMMRSVQSQITKQGWIIPAKRDGEVGTFYRRGEKVAAYKVYFERYFGDRKVDIDYLLDLFKTAKTQQAEIVSTIFAAWNDLLLEGKTPTDDGIVELILNDWHDSKRKITLEQWLKALPWMREKGLVPRGLGKHTKRTS